MKTCFLGTGGYVGQVAARGWPAPPELCEREEAMRSMDTAIRQYKLAEEAGFDWVSISEHHYQPGLMTPNPGILAAAISQQTSRVKIALLGPLVPLINPVRAAEEIAMIDALSHGRVVVLFLRGTPNEHATYGTNPGETREITQEGVQLILRLDRAAAVRLGGQVLPLSDDLGLATDGSGPASAGVLLRQQR